MTTEPEQPARKRWVTPCVIVATIVANSEGVVAAATAESPFSSMGTS